MRTLILRRNLLAAAVAAPAFARAYKGSVQVAVAANFFAPMREIAARFQTITGNEAKLSVGSTGKFYAQIVQGAPFELFLAADSATPTKLVRESRAIAASQRTYAIGRLALYSPTPGLVDADGAVLRGDAFKRISMADPKVAPYGQAAQQTLRALGLEAKLRSRIVLADSVGQVMQQVQSGNAELGFVAWAQVQANPQQGSHWLIPDKLHSAIQQDMVLLKSAEKNLVAQQLAGFTLDTQARGVIQRHGYTLP